LVVLEDQVSMMSRKAHFTEAGVIDLYAEIPRVAAFENDLEQQNATLEAMQLAMIEEM
jgi:hypothetical protein